MHAFLAYPWDILLLMSKWPSLNKGYCFNLILLSWKDDHSVDLPSQWLNRDQSSLSPNQASNEYKIMSNPATLLQIIAFTLWTPSSFVTPFLRFIGRFGKLFTSWAILTTIIRFRIKTARHIGEVEPPFFSGLFHELCLLPKTSPDAWILLKGAENPVSFFLSFNPIPFASVLRCHDN